ncbi:GNAT family N-acetyltransferase [Pontibacter sp. KCTC 32443]|uniref:GNAT family N-acetyltransferase n=1 Tax=Pontibacter TaxID=323449 RepID=UPI00164D319D|nr:MULTISPECIES: GNAT family N-acetyltransferase [Pontibacter]MBC5774055.1 GNAT family N-acetyltransferase [Pontibacter sp. KCTC 32443]
MVFRQASIADIAGMSRVRMAVKENVLSNPDRVTLEDYREMLEENGAGWVCELDGIIVGFAIVDLTDANIWALFVDPDHDKKGIGRKLHDLMLNWSFDQNIDKLWLSTEAGTRAETFYRKAGWQQTGITQSGEVRFEMERRKYRTKTSVSQQSSI